VNRRAFIAAARRRGGVAARGAHDDVEIAICFVGIGFPPHHLGFGLELRAQSPTYRPVNSADLLGGYILDGEWIETTGHVWFSDKGVFFNLNLASARVSMLVDVANVDPENIRRLKSTCGSPDQFSGGCRVTIRGQVGRLDHRQDIPTQHQGILARDIQVLPRQ
jgi:hypothetical protein